MVLLREVPELGAERGLNLLAHDLRSAVAVLHYRGAVADGRTGKHIERTRGKRDERSRADRFVLHERHCFRPADSHDGVHDVERGVEAPAEGVHFEDDVIRVRFHRVRDGAAGIVVHSGVDVAVEGDPDRRFARVFRKGFGTVLRACARKEEGSQE